MKNSGIQWIGEIPNSWEVRKVKQCFYISKKQAHDNNPTILSLARTGVKVRDISNNEGQLAASYDNYNPIVPGDLLLNPMDLYSGANCSLSDVSGVISPAYINLRKKLDLNPKFYDYYFKTQYWTMAMFAHGKGVSFDNRWTMNNETVLNYYLPFPSFETQNRIVDLINRKTAEIDLLIDLENKQIDKLKEYKISVISNIVINGIDNTEYKKSNIRFINQIPALWNEKKLGAVCNVVTDYVASGSFASLAENVQYYDTPNYAMLVRTADVSGKANSSGFVYIDKHAYEFLSNSNLFGGEVMLPNIGASVGDVYIVPKLYERMSLAPNSIIIKTKHIDKYFYYYFLSKQGRENLISLNESAAQPKFNKTKLKQMIVPVPSNEEEEKIVKYLDEKCLEIDALISIKQKKIDDLIEYKKSLIYEYVTGKKEVVL